MDIARLNNHKSFHQGFLQSRYFDLDLQFKFFSSLGWTGPWKENSLITQLRGSNKLSNNSPVHLGFSNHVSEVLEGLLLEALIIENFS